MRAVIDNGKYSEMLTETLPRKIQTEEQNERYLDRVEKMMDKGAPNFSPEEHEIFDLLVVLIEEFEEREYPMPDIEPHERIKYLLEEQGLRQKDLLPIFNSEGVISDILSGRRALTLTSVRRLAEFFHVPATIFIQ